MCSEGRAEVWFKDKKGYTVVPEHNALDRVAAMRKVCDPRRAFEELQARREAGQVKIETKEPAKQGGFLTLTVTPNHRPDRREVYEVDSQTKLAERVTYYHRQGDQWKQVKLIEYLDYNKPIDAKVFDLDLPKDVVRSDQIKRPPGLLKGDLTNEQIAVKVAREFFEAVIAKDYEKAGLIYSGIPAERLRAGFERMNVARIVEVGEPKAGLHPDPTALAVPVKVEFGQRWVQEFSPKVRLTDDETAKRTAKEFLEAIIREDEAAARRILDAGLVLEGFSRQNSAKVKDLFARIKFLRIVEIGKPSTEPGTGLLEVPAKVEVEMKGERTMEFTPYVRPFYNQPNRWTICGGI